MILPYLVALLGIVAPALSKQYTLEYDSKYDNKDSSLRDVTCANGEHGLITHGYKTFRDIPTYPCVGASPHIASSSSHYCGSCWELIYTDTSGDSVSFNFTAIDKPAPGLDENFTISLEGIDHITHGAEHDSALVTAHRRPHKWCFPDEH